MEFTVQKADLLREMSRIQGIVERRNTIPILANVLLRSGGAQLDLRATDLEVGLRTSCPAEVRTPGAITLSAKKLFEITRALPDAPILFQEQANHWVALSCAESRFRMVGLPPEDFPTLVEASFEEGVRLPAAAVRGMIERVIFATTSDDARYSLNGALLLLRKGFVALVASDAHRLAYVSRELGINPRGAEIRVVVPRKALNEVARLCSEMADQEVSFGQVDGHLFFRVGHCTVDGRMLEGNFPNFEKVIPKDNDKEIELAVGTFGDAMRRVSLLSDERTRPVKISLSPSKMEISSHTPEAGEASESLGIDYEGPELSVGFNARYLIDFVGAVGGERIVLSLKDEANQALLRPRDAEGQDYRYVVMPMRI
jgi:DNA polymerase-3 subunit beta